MRDTSPGENDRGAEAAPSVAPERAHGARRPSAAASQSSTDARQRDRRTISDWAHLAYGSVARAPHAARVAPWAFSAATGVHVGDDVLGTISLYTPPPARACSARAVPSRDCVDGSPASSRKPS